MEDRIPHRSQDTGSVAVDSIGGETVGDDVDGEGEEEAEEAEFEFEFPFVSGDGGGDYSPALADDLFADGRIRPFYPVFGRRGGGGGGTGAGDGSTAPVDVAAAPAVVAPRRIRGQLGRLFLEESREQMSSSTESTTSSSADDDGGLEGAPAPETYCVWTPGCSASASPRLPPRKSGSTGSMARWRRISDLVVGRSHSDGKEKFLFLPVTPPPKQPAADKPPSTKPRPRPAAGGGGKKPPPPSEISTVAAAHRISYGTKAAVTPRRTFLPYREDLVGFFANVNGISRSHPHPY